MNQVIEFYVKSVWGNNNFYMVDGIIKDSFQALTGKKTFDERDQIAFEALGFSFKEVIAPRA